MGWGRGWQQGSAKLKDRASQAWREVGAASSIQQPLFLIEFSFFLLSLLSLPPGWGSFCLSMKGGGIETSPYRQAGRINHCLSSPMLTHCLVCVCVGKN